MGDSYKVDIDALRALEARCRQVAAQFDDGGHDTWVRRQEAVGSERLREAFDGFESHWSDGRAKVRRHLDALVERVHAAIDQYERTEADLARQIDDAANQSGPSTSPPSASLAPPAAVVAS